MISKLHTTCRICGSDKLKKYLDLGQMPLSNNLADSTLDSFDVKRFPLEVLFCEECSLSQLSVVIDANEMFGHYVYRSSINKGYVNHCRIMAKELKAKYNLDKNSFQIDIAGNDGALLGEFKDEIGHKVLNVDPAKNMAGICIAAKIPTLTEFWSMITAKKILNTWGKADIITATNVFAHVDDVKEFLQAVKHVLKGVLILEFPYIIDFIEKKEFDTIYFEHLSYFSITPLVRLCEMVGLKVIDVEHQEIHGGTVRVTIAEDLPVSERVNHYLSIEKDLGYTSKEKYLNWSKEVEKTINSFKFGILKTPGRICAFAASAKGNTLLNACGITLGSINYIVDETPEKIGKFSPGTGIPIVSMLDIERSPPDYIVILSWNFKDEIIEKLRKIYNGKYIIPIPEFSIID